VEIVRSRRRLALAQTRWQGREEFVTDEDKWDWEFVQSVIRFHNRHLGVLEVSGGHESVVKTVMSALVSVEERLFTDILPEMFSNRDFRLFCLHHTVFLTDIGYHGHEPDVLERAAAMWLMPQPGDYEYLYPEPSGKDKKLLSGLNNLGLEQLPKCILIPGARVDFDFNNTNSWGRPGDVAVATGLLPDWDYDVGMSLDGIRNYLRAIPTVRL
jgi:hypothetical protein